MPALSRHGPRIAVTLLPLLFAILHALGVLPMGVLQRLDDMVYDARLRATMPGTLDDRVVIVDIDEKSLAEVGRWPWSRDHMARLVDTLFEDHGIAVLGFDTVFAEADDSSGLRQLQQIAQGALAGQPGLAEHIERLRPELDHDARFARSLKDRPVVLGYYFTSDRDGRTSGVLPAPVMLPEVLRGRSILATRWDGFGANIAPLAQAAPRAGFFNAVASSDGVVRSVPLLAEHDGRYYESLSLAMFRLLLGSPRVEPGFPAERFLSHDYQALESVRLVHQNTALAIPVDDRLAALVPFRGRGGPQGGSFTYVSASDVLAGRVPAGRLRHKIVLVGTTAPGLLDQRVTPVGEAYPGVETHANLISRLLDGEVLVKPDYALGYELVVLVVSGLVLALALPLLSAARAVGLSLGVVAAVVGLNFWLYLGHGLVLPLASVLVMCALAFALNMSYGYLVESRAKRQLAQLFGTYVPPELVDEMVRDPHRYDMTATTRELTVMFCDMRGFTRLSETLEPTRLQALLNTVFSRLTRTIRSHRGTIDKYMGDCVMAFWGAPVDTADHAGLAVQTALDMAEAVRQMNQEHARQGLPQIGVGIGLNTGPMCVGDMGSDLRRSYTVVGDAVNLGSRLEGLSPTYGVDIVASDTTRSQAPQFVWQELDRVRVKGRATPVTIHTPLGTPESISDEQAEELRRWDLVLLAWRAQDWDTCDAGLRHLQRQNAEKVLYRLYAQRVASMQRRPPDPGWDGATTFETK
ncbi:adenylate/guanylate cyclase with chase sensor [Hydrogenophaga taeniospiralis CCUG 15921]|uniref:Adenylate/guanylate cyclase with chase sensor n=1 Tax=Hydrogenophaga taeniospiralis CCUG 15921 TaxID=1281780 RepID=A0A9X4NTD9_9BURK|nr:adenylate/guanylate cyclase domain-containing protein [Hydrogenophaga taeniospiralis]MDG5975891.1 adenylate/guanylate cyclase with chase sensor [Hydrogenophaga taeniospiralis CCUG 15921]